MKYHVYHHSILFIVCISNCYQFCFISEHRAPCYSQRHSRALCARKQTGSSPSWGWSSPFIINYQGKKMQTGQRRIRLSISYFNSFTVTLDNKEDINKENAVSIKKNTSFCQFLNFFISSPRKYVTKSCHRAIYHCPVQRQTRKVISIFV